MGEQGSGGPEDPTLIERFFLLLRLPYPLSALVFALLFPASRLLFHLIDAGNVAVALDLAFVQPEAAPLWQRVTIQILQVAVAFYAFWVLRYMRRKTAAAANEIAPLLPGGRRAYRAALGDLPRSWPPILIGALLLGP
ncbi:MAG: hypothetical protein R3291_01830, partial [Thermoplasmata archaeon]|nr:hypothetical protein [Thermoplasmata archaeon]